MQVNRYVHPCEIFPQALKPHDLSKLEIDIRDPSNERIKEHLIGFDKIMLQLFVGGSTGLESRIRRFKNDYLVDENGYDSEEET